MWSETGSFTRLLLSKLKSRPVHSSGLSSGTYSAWLHIHILAIMVTKATWSQYILHYHGVYISKHKTVLKILGKRKKKHKESSNKKVWDNQQVQNWFKKSTEECYAIVARNNLPRLLLLWCIAYVPLRDDKENSALKLD